MKKDFIMHVDSGKHAPVEQPAQRQEARREHHAPKPKKKPAVHKEHALRAFFIILAIVVVALLLFYFTQIDRSFIGKPSIEKPNIDMSLDEFVVEEDYISYMLNEIGAYKLQNIPFSKNLPKIEIIITDTGEVFTARTIDNSLQTIKGAADNPDIRISAENDVMYDVLKSDNVNDALLTKYNQGVLEIELLKDEKELILKGYKGIYDALKV
ncbi:hypothetical protein JXA85_02405 [Candidatus Woesearchaeota archaeon]|nr:hypothetical protein [Candidatus Woesearchaeota archaeon]